MLRLVAAGLSNTEIADDLVGRVLVHIRVNGALGFLLSALPD